MSNPFTVEALEDGNFNLSHELVGPFPGNPVSPKELADALLTLMKIGSHEEAGFLAEAVVAAAPDLAEDPEQENSDE